MAGWSNEDGMSNNAVTAYEEGRFPLSKLKAKHLKKANIPLTLGMAKHLASEGKWEACEWHHSSLYYNETSFYCLDDLDNLLE